jgi:hypothetical protein
MSAERILLPMKRRFPTCHDPVIPLRHESDSTRMKSVQLVAVQNRVISRICAVETCVRRS